MPAVRPRARRGALAPLAAAIVAAGLLAAPAGPSSAAPARDDGVDRVVTWAASPDRVTGSLADQTVRNIVHTTRAGRVVRVSLSNAFGESAVTFDSVFVGRRSTGGALVPGSSRRLTFGRETAVSVPRGGEVLSDPLTMLVKRDTDLAVSIHVDGAVATLTGHNFTATTSYLADGDQAGAESGAAFDTTTTAWHFVDAVLVEAPAEIDTVVAFGDSITDGVGSTTDANQRYPDFLARRFVGQPVDHRYGVSNQGISGNQVLQDGAGENTLARFTRDALGQPDVGTVIVLEGINDIGTGNVTEARQLIAGYRQLIARAHARDVCVLGATLTPFAGTGAPYYTPEKDRIRREVNQFIRSSGEFDGVVDFDKATRDPADRDRFRPAYDSGDHLHPSDIGYKAMADAVDLDLLECDL